MLCQLKEICFVKADLLSGMIISKVLMLKVNCDNGGLI